MNAGDVIIRLVADLKDFAGNIAKATGIVKDFGTQAQQGLSQAERAATRARDSLGRFTKATATGAKGSAASLRDFGNQAQGPLKEFSKGADRSANSMSAFQETIAKVTYKASDTLNGWAEKARSTLSGWASTLRTKATSALEGWANKTASILKGWASSLLHPLQLVRNAIGSIFNIRNLIIGGVIGATIAKVTQLGAAAEQTERKFTLAFGGMSESVRAWSEELGARLKRSSDDIRGSAADLFLFVKNTGLAENAAVDLTKQITELGYAVATMRGGSEEDAIWAMRAGLMGMTRPLIAYGLHLDEAALKTWALKNGLDANTKAWTEQQMVLARAGVVSEHFAKDVEAANAAQQDTIPLLKQIKDQWVDMAQAVYKKWKPAIQEYLTGLRDSLIENQATIVAWADKVGQAALSVIRAFRAVVEFLKTEYLTGWTQSGEAVRIIVRTTVQAVAIVLEEALTEIGKRIPMWILKGAIAGIFLAKDIGKEIGTAIADSISMGIAKAIDVRHGGDLAVKKLNEMLAEEAESKDWGLRVDRRLGALLGEMREKLTPLMADSKQLAQALSQDVKTETDALAAFYGYAAEGAEKQKSAIRSIVQEIKTETDALAAFYGYAAEGMNQQATDMNQAFEDAGKRDPNLKNTETAAIDTYLKTLEKEVELQGLAVDGKQQDVEYQKLLNKLREEGKVTSLLTEEEARASKIIYQQQQFEVKQYLNGLEREAEVLKLINQGKYQEAELQKVVNQFLEKGIELTAEQEARIRKSMENQRLVEVWQNAAKQISGSFEDAFVSITRDAKNWQQYMENIANAVAESMARAVYQATMGKQVEGFVGNLVGSFGGMAAGGGGGWGGGGAPIGQTAEPGLTYNPTFSRGGLVYASSGLFTPKGTDTVPAMLTPGEGVLDQDLTSRLRRVLAVPEPSPVASRPIQINVSAIDAAGVYQFLERYKRPIASMVSDAQTGNHPSRRSER